jgi:DNA repair protein RadC
MTNYCIKELPSEDRPRERLLEHGAKALSMAELLAILIRTGTREKSALDIAREITCDEHRLRKLVTTKDPQELAQIKGVGLVKAATIMAALEFGKRLTTASTLKQTVIGTPEDGASLLMPLLRYENNEHFLLVLLNSKNKVIKKMHISEGSLNSSVVHPREVFAPAILHHAAAIFVGHNHPSGDPTPSKEDRMLTDALVQTGRILGIPVIDHVVIGDGTYFSFREHGYL